MESQPTNLEPAARALAASLLHALRPDFRERAATAEALAELILDAAEAALSLEGGAPAGPPLRTLELLATRVDLFAWDGPPGWDEILIRGLRPPAAAGSALGAARDLPSAAHSPLDGLGDAADRAGQLARAEGAARAESSRFLALGRGAARLDRSLANGPPGEAKQGAASPEAAPADAASVVIALHASLLRLVALAAAAAPLATAEDPAAGALPPPGEDSLAAELDERARAGSDFAAAQDEWLARLLRDNPAAAAPAFRTFFAGLSQWLRVAVVLKEVRDAAREGRASGDPEALIGAIGGWQPVRWSAIRGGVPALYWAELFPPAPADLSPHHRLARECSAALDAVGRLWSARGLSLTAFTALATAAAARCASALALWEELLPG